MSRLGGVRIVLIVAVLSGALFAVLSVPFLTREREMTAGVPSPRAVFEVGLVPVAGGRELCVSDVTIPPDAQLLRFAVGTYRRPGPQLRVTLSGAGYGDRIGVAAGYADNALMSLAMKPPPRTLLGRVCVANEGTTRIALTGTTEERTVSRPVGRIDGKVVRGDAYLAFLERRPASVLQRTHEIAERMSVFRPAIVGPTLLWAIVALVLLGIPLGVVLAALCAVRERGRD